MSQAVSRAWLSVAIEFKFCPREKIVEEFDVIAWEQAIHGLRPFLLRRRWRRFAAFLMAKLPFAPGFRFGGFGAAEKALIDSHGSGHAFAMTDATLAAHFDLENLLPFRVVSGNRHVAVLEIESFIRPQASVRHEQYEVIDLFGIPLEVRIEGLLRVFTRGLVELLVLGGAEPGAMNDLALTLVRRRQIRQVLQPAVTDGGLEHQPQGHDLVVQSAAGRRLVLRLVLAFGCRVGIVVRGHSVNPVFLHLAGSDVVQGKGAEERYEVDTQPHRVAFGPLFAALAFGDDPILFQKLLGGLAERRPVVQDSRAKLAMQGQIPVLGQFAGLQIRVFPASC